MESAIEIERPVRVVYERLTRFSDYPAFLDGVSRVEDLGGDRLRWTATDGQSSEVRVVERTRDEVVAWEGTEPGADAWRASLIALSPKRTRMDLRLEHDPQGLRERAADAFGALERRVTGNLARFKAHVEEHTAPPG